MYHDSMAWLGVLLFCGRRTYRFIATFVNSRNNLVNLLILVRLCCLDTDLLMSHVSYNMPNA